jgi:biotin transport system substrate-specific component
MTGLSLINRYRGRRAAYYLWRNNAGAITMLFLSLMMSCFTGIMAQIVVYLPWTPVPVTGQTLAVLLAGIVLGRWGAMSQLLYIVIGLAGIPWFAGTQGGPGVAAGPTFGYLVGFVVSAYLVGSLVDRYAVLRKLIPLTLILAAANFAVILGLGALYLSIWLTSTMGQTPSLGQILIMGVIPFIPGAIVKTALAAVIGRAIAPYHIEQ